MRSVEAHLPERGPMSRQYKMVYGPLGTLPLRIVCLSNTLTKRYTHYDPTLRKNVPCQGEEECTYCKRHHERRFKAFVAAVRCDTKEVCVAEVTEHAVNCLLDAKVNITKLRGMVFTLKREKKHRNAPVWVLNVEKHKKPENLPADFDPVPYLHRLWGWMDQHATELAVKAAEQEAAADSTPGVNRGEVPY